MSVPISWPAHYRAVWETLALLVIGVATGGVGELEMLRGSSTRRSAADRVVEDNHFFSKAVATRWDGGHGLPESGDLEEMMPTAGQSVTGSTRQRFVRRRTRRTRYSGSVEIYTVHSTRQNVRPRGGALIPTSDLSFASLIDAVEKQNLSRRRT